VQSTVDVAENVLRLNTANVNRKCTLHIFTPSPNGTSVITLLAQWLLPS